MKNILYQDEPVTERQRRNLFIMDSIRKLQPISKADIAQAVQMNLATVSNYVNSYIKKDLVRERGHDISEGGRRPALIHLNSETGYVIGLGLNMYSIVAVLVNITVEVVHEVKKDRKSLENNEETITEMTEAVDELLKTSNIEKKNILGIGLGLPGVVDEKDRTIRWPTLLGQKDLKVLTSIPKIFEDKFSLPTIAENDATSAVFCEKWLGAYADVRQMLYMYSEVGCGIIINGEIYHGATGCAGEFGIAKFEESNPEIGEALGLGRGDMEIGILDQLKSIPPMQRTGAIQDLFLTKKDPITIHDIFKAANKGDLQAIQIVKNASETFGKKIAFLANLLNPEVIVIGGGLEGGKSLLIETVKSIVDEWAMNEVSHGLHIVYSKYQDKAVALGAACNVVRRFFMHV